MIRNGFHFDLGNEVNSILLNNEEEKDVDGLEEKQVKVLLGIDNNNNNNNNNNNHDDDGWSWRGVVRKKRKRITWGIC